MTIDSILTSTPPQEETHLPTPSDEMAREVRIEQSATAVLKEEAIPLNSLRLTQYIAAGCTGTSSVIAGTLSLIFGFCLTPPLTAPAIGLAYTAFECCLSSVGVGIWAARTEEPNGG